MAKFGLGKGLGALIPEHQQFFEHTEQESPESSVRLVPIESLVPNPDQPRKSFPQDSLNELAESIRRHGLLQPLLVHQDAAGRYVIIAGERRYRAAKLAGLAEVPVIVRSVQDDTHLELSLVENIQREDLDPIEEARAYQRLMELTGATQEHVAEMVGKSRAAVANAVRLLKLSSTIQDAIKEDKITAGHARALLALEEPQAQERLYRSIIEENLSVRETESRVQQLLGTASSGRKQKKATPSKDSGAIAEPSDPELKALKERLIQRFGTKVEIAGTQEAGTIKIHYFSPDDLQRIYEVLGLE
ncbi:MAG: ParB/RepB/Spo0J family partition protein [Rectinema sp.]|nr:ParB/RepB/Spo0J family partition protein [Rectinema sp.]